MPASDGVARWSADAAPSSAASSAPPDGASSSAWSRERQAERRRRPRGSAATGRRVNTPSSQKTSQNRARPWAATPGSCSSMTERTYASVPSGRRPELGRDGVRAEVGRDDLDRALRARAGRPPRGAGSRSRGRGRSRTWPRSSSRRGRASRRASAGRAPAARRSMAARVAATVERIPPPAARISR